MTQNVTIIHYTISYPFFTCFQNDKTLSNIASIIADSHSCGGTDGNNFDTSSLIDVRGWRVTTSSSVVVPFSDPDFRAFIQDLNEFTCSDTVENNDCNLLLVAFNSDNFFQHTCVFPLLWITAPSIFLFGQENQHIVFWFHHWH
jgi:hypothetical protein